MTVHDIDISNSNVLVVDDNPQNLQVVGNLLKPHNLNLQFVMSGDKVIEAVTEHPPDLILLDIQMPGMDGFEVSRTLHQHPLYTDIPVIFLTAAYKDEESIVKGFQSGGVDYVTKPFFSEELIARIKTHLQLKKYKEYLKELSYTDSLTGLLNRRSMLDRIHEEKKRTRRSGIPFTVVIADVDYFKKVNDTYGHDCGDVVLQEIAKTLKQTVREQDCLARWGGEEFLLLLPETDGGGGITLSNKLRHVVEEMNVECRSNRIHVTMTFGISDCNLENSITECIKQADEALYKGKEEGRNRCIIYSNHD